jgi:hypothetical protein
LLLPIQLPRFFFLERVVDFAHHADQVGRFFVALEAPGQRAFRVQLAALVERPYLDAVIGIQPVTSFVQQLHDSGFSL